MGGSYDIIGDEYSQVLEICLSSGQRVTAEPNTMLYQSSGIEMDADMGNVGQALTRACCAGASLFRLHLINKGSGIEKLGLTPPFPARIIPVDLQQNGGAIVVNRGAFLAAFGSNWSISIKRVRGLRQCVGGGQGLFLNVLQGDGTVFLNAGGTVMTRMLQPGEEIIVDHHSILAVANTVELDVRGVGGFMVCCCAGQGLFNAALRGPGFVMLQTMGQLKMRKAVGGAPPPKKREANAGGAVAGGLIRAALAA